MIIMTRGEFRRLPKNTELFVLLWCPDWVAIVRYKKCGKPGALNLNLEYDDLGSAHLHSPKFCEFKVGNVFLTLGDAQKRLRKLSKNPPSDWPVSSSQLALFTSANSAGSAKHQVVTTGN